MNPAFLLAICTCFTYTEAVDMDQGQDNRPATLADVRESENRIIEAMRDMQTELLRGFEAFSTVPFR
jgi:hypothetical protein